MHYSPNFTCSYFLSRLEEKNCNLTQVKIDEVLCLVCYIAAKVSANNAVPSWVVFLVKFLKKEKRGIKAKKAHMKIVKYILLAGSVHTLSPLLPPAASLDSPKPDTITLSKVVTDTTRPLHRTV